MSISTNKDLIPVINKFFSSQPVEKVWLFGSFARGEETANSDIDLLVQLDHTVPVGLFKYITMMKELEDKLGRKVDMVENEGLMDFARPYVDDDKILLYERAN